MAGKLRRTTLIALVFAAALQAPAAAKDPKTSFRAESDGLPVATVQGAWTVEGRTARLEVRGAGATDTRFVAEYRSPFVKELEGDCGFQWVNALSDDMNLKQSFRVRRKGGPWSPWFAMKMRLRNPSGQLLCAFGSGGTGRVQMDFRLAGSLVGPALIDGYYEITLPK